MAAVRKPQWAVPSSHEAGRQVDDYTGTRPSNVLLGAAGVHYVIARLLRSGLIGTATPTGTPNIDVLVSTVTGDHLCAVQVKTRSGRSGDRGWAMGPKNEIPSPGLFYVLVDYEREHVEGHPVCYVLPSEVVAAVLKLSHRRWLDTPGRNGRPHMHSNLRNLMKDYDDRPGLPPIGYGAGWLDQYRERWELLG